jgi:hypothetical protein
MSGVLFINMDFTLWQGILIISGIQLIFSFVIGVLVFQILGCLLKFKKRKWGIALKISLVVNVLSLGLQLLAYLFPQSINTRIFLLVLSEIAVLVLGAYLVKSSYKVSLNKGLLVIFIFMLVNFILGFPVGLLLAYVSYFLGIGPMPI